MSSVAPSLQAAPFDLERALLAVVAGGAVKTPPYPAVALKLNQLVQRGDYGLGELVKVVQADQALAAQAISCANSAFYSRAEVTSLREAVTRLGASELARLALASQLAAATRAPGALLDLKRKVWQDGVASALICRTLAPGRGLLPDETFLCGLLHDFGQVLALSAIEELLQRYPGAEARDAASWEPLLERIHVGLGLLLAVRWKLPMLFSEAIEQHHEGGARKAAHPAMVELVRLSDVVVAMLGQKPHLSEEDLAGVEQLAPPERAALAAALPGLGAVISAFEGPPQARPGPSKLLSPPPLPEAELAPLLLPVRLLAPVPGAEYQLQAIGERAWVMDGGIPLAENGLLEASIDDAPGPLQLWAKVRRCAGERGHFRIECQPFVLNAGLQRRWAELVGQARPQR